MEHVQSEHMQEGTADGTGSDGTGDRIPNEKPQSAREKRRIACIQNPIYNGMGL